MALKSTLLQELILQCEPQFYFSPFLPSLWKIFFGGATQSLSSPRRRKGALGNWNSEALRVRDTAWKVHIMAIEALV